MNKEGGLSYFDVTTGATVEKLDNTTFVSPQLLSYLPMTTEGALKSPP